VRFDLATVGVDEGLGDRQPDAGPAVLAIAGGVGPIEAIEQPRKMVARHPGAGVRDRDHQFVIGSGGRHVDTSTRPGVAQRIVESLMPRRCGASTLKGLVGGRPEAVDRRVADGLLRPFGA
jgi:hypothetical protein